MRSNPAGLVLLIIFITLTCVLPVEAVPPLPAEFYGNVLIDGMPAPAGTTITALVQNVPKGSITTDIDGFYGGPGLFDPRLKVNVTEEEYQAGNLIITFQINGIPASQSTIFEPGTAQQFDVYTGTASAGEIIGPGLTPVPAQTVPLETPQPGDNNSEPPQQEPSENRPSIQYGLDSDETFTSDDGMSSVSFKTDTLLFSPSGQFLENVTIISRSIGDLPPVTTNQSLMFSGYAYEIFPERTYFNPEGIFSFLVPFEQASEMMAFNPQIYKYNPQTASWDQIRTSSNQFTGDISGTIYEAAIYGLFTENMTASATPTPESPVTIPPSLAPIAGQPPAPMYPQNPPAGPPGSVSEPPVYAQAYETPITPIPTVFTPESTPALPEPQLTEAPVQMETPAPEITQGTPEPTQITQPSGPSPIDIIKKMLNSGKTTMSSPVGLIIGLVLLIVIINAIVYVVYTRWWLVRNP